MMAGVNMLHVPYRGDTPAISDLVGGQVQVYFGTLGGSIEHIRAGTLRPLAVTSMARTEVLPNIPTVGDFLPGYQASAWQGLVAPKNAPTEIVDKLNKEINGALADPIMKARFAVVLPGRKHQGNGRRKQPLRFPCWKQRWQTQVLCLRFESSDRVIVFTGDTGPSDAVTELAKGADLLVTPTSSFKDRMQLMIETGRWQAMTPAEQARVLAQATRNITLEDIGKMATRANVKTVVLSHSNARSDGGEAWAAEVKEHFSGQVVVAKDLMEF
jgi:hypothetical protein